MRTLISHTDGQDLIEYALLASLVSLTVLSGVMLLGDGVGSLTDGTFQRIVAALLAAR